MVSSSSGKLGGGGRGQETWRWRKEVTGPEGEGESGILNPCSVVGSRGRSIQNQSYGLRKQGKKCKFYLAS